MTIKDNYLRIKNEIPQNVNIIVVTKYHSDEAVLTAYDAGIRDFGENRIEGFLSRVALLPSDANVHFIGTLQSRKVKEIGDHLYTLHSLDRLSVAKEIHKHCDHDVECYVQVNVSGEVSKHGLEPDAVPEFLEQLSAYPNVKIVGLMTMAPHTTDEHIINQTFAKLAALKQTLAKDNAHNIQLKELSMGMSNDYLLAVQHGATVVRVGSKIMGQG